MGETFVLAIVNIPLKRSHLTAFLTLGLLLCAAGAWAFVSHGKNGFDTLPLYWYLLFIMVPPFCFLSFVRMWRVGVGSEWWLAVGLLLLLPQLCVWLLAVAGVLHY